MSLRSCGHRYLSAEGIADPAWVGAGRQHPVPVRGGSIHGDRQAASVEFVVRPVHDVVAAPAQACAHLIAEAAFQRRAGWHLKVRVKRVRPGERRKSPAARPAATPIKPARRKHSSRCSPGRPDQPGHRAQEPRRAGCRGADAGHHGNGDRGPHGPRRSGRAGADLSKAPGDAYLLGDYHVVASGGSSGQRGVFLYGWDAWAICWASMVRFPQRDWAADPALAGVRRVAAMVAAYDAHVTG